jgi:hypothetical protein
MESALLMERTLNMKGRSPEGEAAAKVLPMAAGLLCGVRSASKCRSE